MIQDTTLRMVVQAVDQATAPLENVKQKLDEVTGGMEDAKDTAGKALPQIGKGADELSDSLDDLGQSAAGAALHLGPGMIQAIAAAGFAFVALVKYIRDAAEEHRRLEDLATTLSLPYETVKEYGKAWEEVAVQLNEAARGYTKLKEAQLAAFSAINIDPSSSTQTDRLRTLVSLGKGTELEKIDALRRLFGVDDKQALEIIRRENERFFNSVTAANLGISADAAKKIFEGQDAGLTPQLAQSVRDFRTTEGIGFGQLDVSRLTSRLPTPNAAEEQIKGVKELESTIADIQREAERNRKEQERESVQATREAERERTQALRDEMKSQEIEFNRFMERRKAAAAEIAMTQKMIDEKFSADSLDKVAKASGEAAAETLKNIKLPFEDFTTAVKNGFDNIVRTGDISMKRLVANIIAELTRKSLFEAIDKLADALGSALSGGSSKGGLLGGIASFVGSLFGKAGGGRASGWEWVGEEGPELAYFGAGGRVVNSRQAAFMGSGDSGKRAPTIVNNHTYTISGVETSQVVAYIEQTRRQDQMANVKMLERNGFGRMR